MPSNQPVRNTVPVLVGVGGILFWTVRDDFSKKPILSAPLIVVCMQKRPRKGCTVSLDKCAVYPRALQGLPKSTHPLPFGILCTCSFGAGVCICLIPCTPCIGSFVGYAPDARRWSLLALPPDADICHIYTASATPRIPCTSSFGALLPAAPRIFSA